jgi:flagellar basal-body rod modification protein FlgD
MGKDDFLKILVAQLQAQNPLDPQDPNEFTAQLAQFSSLEQLMNMNQTIQSLILYSASQSNNLALMFVGKNILAAGDTFSYKTSETQPEMIYKLASDAETVNITVYDEEGNIVKTINLTNQGAGEHRIEFDGLDNNNSPLPDGNYRFEVSAKDADGNDITTSTYIMGLVERIVFENGYTYLIVNGERISISDVTEVS